MSLVWVLPPYVPLLGHSQDFTPTSYKPRTLGRSSASTKTSRTPPCQTSKSPLHPKEVENPTNTPSSSSVAAQGLQTPSFAAGCVMIGTSRLPATMRLICKLICLAFETLSKANSLVGKLNHALPCPKLPSVVMSHLACSPDDVPWDVGRLPITKMPTADPHSQHREYLPSHTFPSLVSVARTAPKAEAKPKLAKGDHDPKSRSTMSGAH